VATADAALGSMRRSASADVQHAMQRARAHLERRLALIALPVPDDVGRSKTLRTAAIVAARRCSVITSVPGVRARSSPLDIHSEEVRGTSSSIAGGFTCGSIAPRG
jgi:hypothetical protein